MRPFAPPRSCAAPAYGVLRGMRAGVLAALCVLLPVAGHVLSQGHTPRWAVVATTGVVAVLGAAVLTRRRLNDTQLLVALAAAQLAHHAVYSLPGVCTAVTVRGGSPGGLSWLVEHDTVAGPPPGMVLAGHLLTLLLAARLLGITERLPWQRRPLLAAVRRLLLFRWPLLGRTDATGPQPPIRTSAAPLRPAASVRLNEGRAPPHRGISPHALYRPLPLGAPCLP
ncbi:hypothetical protein [Streptomyces sp. NPDC059010]|uniref:hypothetical protein n=1 Tax=Streptomyces sp. NPDC059010 TaxID=3346695 RepID=UPI0036A69D01